MIEIFKQKNPANLLLLLIVGVLVKIPMFLEPHDAVIRPGDGILFEKIISFFSSAAKSNPVLYPLLTFALLFLQAVMLTRFINIQRMMNKSTYLPGLSYMLITSLLPEWNYFSAPYLCNTFMLFILSALFGIYNKPNAKGTIFNMGLALGLQDFFLFLPSLLLSGSCWQWQLCARSGLHEWLICLLGITTPFYFYAIYTVINGSWSWQEFVPQITLDFPSLKQSAWLSGSVFLIMIPFLTGGYYVQENLRRMLINVRKGWSLLLLYLLTALLLPFVNSSDTFENWIMAMVPMAAFHGYTYFYSAWRVYPLIVFWLTVAFIIGYQYYGPGW